MEKKQTLPTTIELVIHPNTTTNNNDNTLESGPPYSTKQANLHRLHTAILTANDGLTCTACLMIGVGAMSLDHVTLAMILTGVAGLIMGASCMALGEFVSRNYDLNFEVIEGVGPIEEPVIETEGVYLSKDPIVAAVATGAAFSVGAVVPLIVAILMREYNLGLGMVEGATSTVLAMVGWLGPFLGRAPALRAALRVLLCGWLAMAVTFGFMILMIDN